MALAQLNKDVTMHGAPTDPIVQVKAHQLQHFPESWVNHLKNAYKNEIEFLEEGSTTVDKKLDNIRKETKEVCCLACPSRLACLLVKDVSKNLKHKISISHNPMNEMILLKSEFFTITFPFDTSIGKITFNGVKISTREFISFLTHCEVIKHLDTKMVQELAERLVK